MMTFDQWYAARMESHPVIETAHVLRLIQEIANASWDAATMVSSLPGPVNGNAKVAGFQRPTTFKRPKDEIDPIEAANPSNIQYTNTKHWNIWDESKCNWAATGLTKEQAWYWANRYNAKEPFKCYYPIPVAYESKEN